MDQVDANLTVGGWVAEHPQTSRIFESLQIDYCCGGDQSLGEACQDRGLDPESVLLQLERAIEVDEAGTDNWLTTSLTELCDHIEQTHHAYLRQELPRLSGLIEKVCSAHGGDHPELMTVQDTFAALRAELEPHMLKEEQVLFPAIRELEKCNVRPSFPFGTVANPVRMMEQEHNIAGSALSQLHELTDGYRVPVNACQTYLTMLHGLEELESDMHRHVHKENQVLFPRAIALESGRVAT